jgi:hypothetical protein
MRTDKSPSGRERIIARQLIAGASQREACLAAGYTPQTCKAKAFIIVKREGVRQAMCEIGQKLTPHMPPQYREGYSEALLELEPSLETYAAMIRGAARLIADSSLQPSKSRLPQRPELTPEQKANLEQQVAELQRAADTTSAPAQPGDTKLVEVSPREQQSGLPRSDTVSRLPRSDQGHVVLPAFGGAASVNVSREEDVEVDPALVALYEQQMREKYWREWRQKHPSR